MDSRKNPSVWHPALWAAILAAGIFLPIFAVQAAVYYVDNTVNDTNVASATPDSTTYDPATFSTSTGSASVYKTIADVNAKSFVAGDQVLFRKGQVWREMITTKTSGAAGSPIVYGTFGSGVRPRITAADIVTGLEASSTANIYTTSTLAVTPNVLLVDGEMGQQKNSVAALASDNDWHFSSGTLSIYSSEDISGKTVEVGVRDKVINSTKSYVTFRGLELDSGNNASAGAGVYISGTGATGVTVDDCEIKYNLYGVLFFTTNVQAGGHAVSNSVIYENRSSGVHVNAGTDHSSADNRTRIYNNEIYDNEGFGILAYSSY